MDGNEEYHQLLLQNQIYLKALQRKSVSVYTLGFKKLKFRNSKYEVPTNVENPKVFQAVVPSIAQAYYMDRVEESVQLLEQKKHEEAMEKKRAKKSSRLTSTNPSGITIDIHAIQEKLLAEKEKEKASALNKPLTEPKLPSFGRPTRRILEEMEEAKKLVELREREEKKKQKLDRKFDLVENGVHYVYNKQGYKVTIEEYEKEKLEEQEQKRREEERRIQREREEMEGLSPTNRNTVFTGAILEKTSKYVETIRQQAEAERNGPERLPESTYPLDKGDKVLPLAHFVNYPEFHLLDKDDVMMTIEHCQNCESHNWANHHVEEQYLEAVNNIKDTMELFVKDFPIRFFCVLKPVEDFKSFFRSTYRKSISPGSPTRPHSGSAIFQAAANAAAATTLCTESPPARVGSLEVQIVLNNGKEKIQHILHSKLASGNWPKLANILLLFEAILTKYDYSRIKGVAYKDTIKNKRKSQITNNDIFQALNNNAAKRTTISPEKQIEKLRKSIILVPSIDNRQFRVPPKVDLTDFLSRKPNQGTTPTSAATTPSARSFQDPNPGVQQELKPSEMIAMSKAASSKQIQSSPHHAQPPLPQVKEEPAKAAPSANKNSTSQAPPVSQEQPPPQIIPPTQSEKKVQDLRKTEEVVKPQVKEEQAERKPLESKQISEPLQQPPPRSSQPTPSQMTPATESQQKPATAPTSRRPSIDNESKSKKADPLPPASQSAVPLLVETEKTSEAKTTEEKKSESKPVSRKPSVHNVLSPVQPSAEPPPSIDPVPIQHPVESKVSAAQLSARKQSNPSIEEVFHPISNDMQQKQDQPAGNNNEEDDLYSIEDFEALTSQQNSPQKAPKRSFEPVSAANLPQVTGSKPSSKPATPPAVLNLSGLPASDNIQELPPQNNAGSNPRTPPAVIQRVLSHDHMNETKQALLNIQQMLDEDAYEDEDFDENEGGAGSGGGGAGGANKQGDNKKNSEDYWNQEILHELGLTHDESGLLE